MPTPDEDSVAVPPSPPVETSSLRSSCPPDDERLTSSRARADSIQEDDGHTISGRQQVPTPEPDTPREEAEKGEHIEDAAAGAERKVRDSEESPSPVSSPDAQGESWSAQSVIGRAGDVGRSTVKAGEGNVGARYLTYPPLRRNAVSISLTTFAHVIGQDGWKH